MDGRYLSLLLLAAWIVVMMATLAWAFRRRQARAASGGGCLTEAVVFLFVGAVATFLLAAGTIFVTRR